MAADTGWNGARIVSRAAHLHNTYRQPEVECLTHKFVDDTTRSEILDRGATSRMQLFVDELLEWSRQQAMIVNGRKTKEMIIGPITRQPPPQLTLDGTTID